MWRCLLVLIQDRLAASMAEVVEMLRSRVMMMCGMVHGHVVERAMVGLLCMHKGVTHQLGTRF